MYTGSSLLRTMELILGLPPMSQYDAAAIPMFNSFTNTADLTPYQKREARVDLNEINAPNAPGAQKSARWGFSKEDTLPDIEFNEVIWKSVKGANSPMPAPVRSALVRVIESDDKEKRNAKNANERPARARGGSEHRPG
jgi:hypothetical protein